MAYKVTNMREVDWRNLSEKELFGAIDGFKEFEREFQCTSFDKEGDYYAIYEDVDANNHDLRKYAVYLNSTGRLICLTGDAGYALDCCYDDTDFYWKRAELYRQIAIAAGWPEELPPTKRYTIRIHRLVDIEVTVHNGDEAETIADRLAAGSIERYCSRMNNIMLGDCNDEVAGIWEAPDENEGVWDWSLTADECKEILDWKE